MSAEILESAMERMKNNLASHAGAKTPSGVMVVDRRSLDLGQRMYPPVELYGEVPSNAGYFSFKYAIDRIIGCTLLLVMSPAIAILWCLVKMTSRGPGFYVQRRVGLNGKLFDIVKLRTMVLNAEGQGKAVWSSCRDKRITLLGRLMRKLHLDELPQLLNVARGEMSLVGPRPERPEITRSLEKLIPNYQLRHRVKPGVTGLAQINIEPDRHINMTRQKQVLDLRYVNNAGLWLDARMMLATFLRMLGIKGKFVIQITGLKQEITCDELKSVGYQFNTPEQDLWNPSKGEFVPAEKLAR